MGLWDPTTFAPKSDYYIYTCFLGRCYVRNGKHQLALNWKKLEAETARSISSRGWVIGYGYMYPCTWEIAAKARFAQEPGE